MYTEFSNYMSALGLSSEEFRNGVAAGVSGGSDSMALALLLEAWCAEHDVPFQALICDHGLRKESRNEAIITAERLERKGIETKILSLRVEPGTGIQERARNARYKAMAGYMRRCNPSFGILAVAHHAMDQAETLAHRMNSGTSTPLGRAGMLPVRVMDEMLLIRPLLECGRGTLRDFLREENMQWVEDPSNENTMFTRVRWRKHLSQHPEEVQQLLAEAEKGLTLARETEAEKRQILRNSIISYEDFGAAMVDMSCVPDNAAGAEAVREMLHRASGRVQSADISAFLSCRTVSRTLGGAQISHEGNVAWVFRETAHLPPSVPCAPFVSWDNRIRMGRESHRGFLSCVGMEDATKFKRRFRDVKIPHKVFSGIPCLRDKYDIISIPQIGVGEYVSVIPVMRSMPLISCPNLRDIDEQCSLTFSS